MGERHERQRRDLASRKARWRIIRYLNCAQATLSVAAGGGPFGEAVLKAVCPLEGGGVSMGSTCGVVSGGCVAIALAHLSEDARDPWPDGPPYDLMRKYTEWFEKEFGSTVCRERTGVEVLKPSGFANYLITGKVYSRCVAHIGRSASFLVTLSGAHAGAAGGRRAYLRGLCAGDVLRGIRDETGAGDARFEALSVALDGGVGLSGGLCGALAGALLSIGDVCGIRPTVSGFGGTLAPFLRGHVNMYLGLDKPELWSLGGRLARGFIDEFGSLECRRLTGRSFGDAEDLFDYVPGADVCSRVKSWCRDRGAELIGEAGPHLPLCTGGLSL